MKTTLLVADDHHLVRAGLCALLSAQDDFSVVAETGDGLEASRLIAEVRPDVAVLDLMLPGLNGLEVARQAARCVPRPQIVMLTMYNNEAYVAEAFRNGAAAYVLKDSTAEDLAQAVRSVMEGRRFLSPPLSEGALETYLQRAQQGGRDRLDSLTSREREVLQLVAEGRTNAEIAGRLFISRRTVEVHRARVLRKLGLRSTADLTRFAVQHGIVTAEVRASRPPDATIAA